MKQSICRRKRLKGVRFPKQPAVAKPGVQPVSHFHPQHPARLFGWDDDRTTTRDRSRWA